jgi:hypothetical protein
MNDLRLTETNSADDSAGKTWGLEGNLFWYLISGAFVSVILMLVLFSSWRWSFAAATATAAVPLSLTLLYIFGLRQGKPRGFDRDLIESWFSGAGFGPDLPQKTSHPLEGSHNV